MIAHLIDLMAYTEWANGVYFHAWGKSPVREHEELRGRMGHILGVQDGFMAVFRGQEPSLAPGEGAASFAALKQWAQSSHATIRAFAAEQDAASLARRVTIPWIPDPPCVITVAEALVQVALHTQHHRGQLMTRLRDLGGEPKNVDWIIWVWKGRPAARWG